MRADIRNERWARILGMRHRPVPRALAVLLATCLVTLGALASGMSVAQAHDELIGSSPEPGATADAAPAQIELRFSGEIQELGTEVVVTSDEGGTVSDGAVQVDGSTVVQPLTPDLPPGGYTVAWRATSSDGHPLSNRFEFTVADRAAAGAESSSPAASRATTDVGEASAGSTAGPSSDGGVWIAVAAACALLIAALVGARQLRRPS